MKTTGVYHTKTILLWGLVCFLLLAGVTSQGLRPAAANGPTSHGLPTSQRIPASPQAAQPIISWEHDQLAPNVAFGDGLGQHLAVWEDHHWGLGDDWDIYAQRLDRAGNRVGAAFGVSWDGSKHRLAPSVAYDRYWEQFLVAWEYEYSATDHDVYARLVGDDGSLVTGETVIAGSGSYESAPAIAYNEGAGEYLLVWQRLVGSGEFAHYDIYGRRVAADGSAVGSEFAIANTSRDERAPAVAVDEINNRYFVVWSDKSLDGDYDIYGRRVNADGSLVGSNKVAISDWDYDQSNPRLAFGTLAGQFLVAWQDHHFGDAGGWDVNGQRVDSTGTLYGNHIVIAGAGDSRDMIYPDVTYSARANAFAIAWELALSTTDHDIYRRMVGSTGSTLEDPQYVTTQINIEGRPAIASADDLSHLIAWEDGRNATLGVDIYGEALTIGLPRLTGYVYEGDVGDESTPLSGVKMALYCSADSGQHGTLVGRATTEVDGAYILVAADVCGYYNIVETDPAGYTSAGATTVGGAVVNANWIQYTGPLTTQTRGDNKFWDHPPAVSTDCNSCADCSAKLDGTYDVVRLTTDLSGISDECVLFGADQATFDCQGHTIAGENANEFSYGIRIEGYSGNTIQNCTVSDLESGISLINAYDSQVLNNTVTGSRAGVHLSTSQDNTLSGNQLNQNQYGVLLAASDGNALTGNTMCKQKQQDIYAPEATSGNTRSANKCDFIFNWNGDEGVSVCDQVCTPNVATTCSAAGDCQNALNGDFNLITLDQDMSVADGLTVTGNHLTLDCDGHTLTGSGSGAGVLIDNRIGVEVLNCRIQGFGTGLELRSSALSNILTNIVTQNEVGARLGASDPLVEAQGNTIGGNRLESNALYGLALDDAHDNDITANVMKNNGLYGLWVSSDACNNAVTLNVAGNGGALFYQHDNPSAGTVPAGSYGQVVLCNVGNAVVENLTLNNTPPASPPGGGEQRGGGDGILFVGASNSQVRGNTLQNTNGIAAFDSDDVAIHRNNVSASISDAISLDGSLRGQVYTNTLQNNGAAGIALRAGADEAEVYDNTIRGNRQGISVNGADDAYLHDNRISDNTTQGVNVTLASGAALADNVITLNDIGLFFDNDTDSASVNDNKICYNTASDIYNNGTSNGGDGNTCALSAYWWDDGITFPNSGCDKRCVGYYQYHYGYSFANPPKGELSFGCPFNSCQGDYIDTFGVDQVFITAHVCIGLPLCLPFVGCYCVGYDASVPTPLPDPQALAYYGIYRFVGRPGECTGMSNTSLRFFYQDRYPSEYQTGAQKVSDLTYSGKLENAIDASHGAIASWEIISRFLGSIDQYTRWGSQANQVLGQVKAAVDSNQLGSLIIHHITDAHTVVATNYRDYGDTARIYIYDSNVISWSTEYGTNEDQYPYIQIDKVQNTFSYEDRPDDYIIAFLPYSVSNGSFEIPGSMHQILSWGSADTQVEDEEGNRLGWMDGAFLNEIPGAAPMPGWGGSQVQEGENQFYLLPPADYTVHITGRQTGVYTTAAFLDTSMVLLQDVAADEDSEDTLSLYYRPGEPPVPSVALATLDPSKPFSLTLGAGFGSDTVRLYAVRGGTLAPGGPLALRVSDDYEALIYTNRGPDPQPYGVQFQNSMAGAAEQVGEDLPTAFRSGLVIGPMETHVLRPDDWLNLAGSEISVQVLACGDGVCSAGEEAASCPEDCAATTCVEPYDDMVVDASTLLCPGTYALPDANEDGVIRVDGDGVELDCAGAKLVGDGAGIGILSAGTDGVSVTGCRVEGYAYGVRLQDASGGEIAASSVTSSTVWAVEAVGTDAAQLSRNVILDNANGVRIAGASGTGLSQNVICRSAGLDVSAEGSSGSTGSQNVCSQAAGWAEGGAEGCRYPCATAPVWSDVFLPLLIKGD